MSVNIHGKEYVTVAERLTEARADLVSINTEVVPNGGAVIVKATVVTKKGTFTGISAANPTKQIEKQSPYEVAETSAVGRALGFAGYGAVDSIASADEMRKADDTPAFLKDESEKPVGRPITPKQLNFLAQLMAVHKVSNEEISKRNRVADVAKLTSVQASAEIDALIKLAKDIDDEERSDRDAVTN